MYTYYALIYICIYLLLLFTIRSDPDPIRSAGFRGANHRVIECGNSVFYTYVTCENKMREIYFNDF